MASQKLVKEPNAKHTSEGKNSHAHIFHSLEIFLYIRLLLRFAELPDKYKCKGCADVWTFKAGDQTADPPCRIQEKIHQFIAGTDTSFPCLFLCTPDTKMFLFSQF